MKIFPTKPDDERFVDLAGKHQGAWFVLGYAGADSRGQNRRWWCRCLCGLEKSVRGSLLTSGDSKCCASAACRAALRRGEICRDLTPAGINAEALASEVLAGVRSMLAEIAPDHETYNRLVVRIPEPGATSVTVMSFARHCGKEMTEPIDVSTPLDIRVMADTQSACAAARESGRSAGSVLASLAAAR